MRLAIKSTILVVAIILFLAPTAITVFAQPSDIVISKERGFTRLFVEPSLIGHEFAQRGDQYHLPELSAIKSSFTSTHLIRSLISQNKSTVGIA
jgi:hypothetical protein